MEEGEAELGLRYLREVLMRLVGYLAYGAR